MLYASAVNESIKNRNRFSAVDEIWIGRVVGVERFFIAVVVILYDILSHPRFSSAVVWTTGGREMCLSSATCSKTFIVLRALAFAFDLSIVVIIL